MWNYFLSRPILIKIPYQQHILNDIVTHPNHHRIMDLHHYVTMEHTIMSHGLHYGIVSMKLVLLLDVFLHRNIKDKIHSKILIFSYVLALNMLF